MKLQDSDVSICSFYTKESITKALVKLTGTLVFVSVGVKAQSLRIVYDFLKDEIHYYKTTPNDKIGKPISLPVVGRNQIITRTNQMPI